MDDVSVEWKGSDGGVHLKYITAKRSSHRSK
jgi:hypothetical protein